MHIVICPSCQKIQRVIIGSKDKIMNTPVICPKCDMMRTQRRTRKERKIFGGLGALFSK